MSSSENSLTSPKEFGGAASKELVQANSIKKMENCFMRLRYLRDDSFVSYGQAEPACSAFPDGASGTRGNLYGNVCRLKKSQIASLAFSLSDRLPASSSLSCPLPPGQWCPSPSTV